MNDRQRRIQALLRLLADRSRFRMLCVLVEGPLHVSQLAVRVGLSQSCATRHVQALAAAEAVACRRDGKRVMVRVRQDDDVIRTLIAWIGGAAPGKLLQLPAEPAGPRTSASRRRRPRGAQEVSPAPGPDSGTPPAATSEAPEPMPPARIRALEDFLL